MSQLNTNIAPFHSSVFPTVTSVQELLTALATASGGSTGVSDLQARVLSFQAPASPVAITQTYATTAATVPTATVAAVATDASGLTLYGFAQAQADAIPVAINALTADVLAIRKVVNQLIDILQAAGLAA